MKGRSPGHQRQLVFEEARSANVAGPAWWRGNIRIVLPVQAQFISIETEAHAHFTGWSFVRIDNLDLRDGPAAT